LSQLIPSSLNILLDPAFLSYKQLPLGNLAWVVPSIVWVLQVRWKSHIISPPSGLPAGFHPFQSQAQCKCPAPNSSRPAATELCTKSLTHGHLSEHRRMLEPSVVPWPMT
jgi:hypothetical protein